MFVLIQLSSISPLKKKKEIFILFKKKKTFFG